MFLSLRGLKKLIDHTVLLRHKHILRLGWHGLLRLSLNPRKPVQGLPRERYDFHIFVKSVDFRLINKHSDLLINELQQGKRLQESEILRTPLNLPQICP